MAPGIEDKIRITTESVNWIHRLEAEPEEATADEFADWLRKSPHHLPSFLKQSRIETAMRRVRAERIAQRREAARADAAAYVNTAERADAAAHVSAAERADAAAYVTTAERADAAAYVNAAQRADAVQVDASAPAASVSSAASVPAASAPAESVASAASAASAASVPAAAAAARASAAVAASLRSWRWARPTLIATTLFATALAVLVLLLAPPLIIDPTLHGSPTIEVDVRFADGSTARLSPGSQIREERLAWFRKIEVIQGSAQFSVKHRFLQSFKVRTDSALITSTGTQFNVSRIDKRTGVHVVDGSVNVESSVPGHGTVQSLRAGESVDVSMTGQIENFHRAPAPAAADFEGTVPLSTLVEEFNHRKLLPQIVIEGKIGEQRFERPHQTLTPDAWLASLANYPDIKIEQHGDRATIRADDAHRSSSPH